MQRLVAHLLTVAEDFRSRIVQAEWLHCCNPHALGWATLFGVSEDSSLDFERVANSLDPSVVKRWNAQQRDFHRFVSAPNRAEWIIGHTNNCTRGAAGIPIGALKVYPMSPLITTEHNQELLDWLYPLWLQFLSTGEPPPVRK